MNKIRHVIQVELGQPVASDDTFVSLGADSLHLLTICAEVEIMFDLGVGVDLAHDLDISASMTIKQFESKVLEYLDLNL